MSASVDIDSQKKSRPRRSRSKGKKHFAYMSISSNYPIQTSRSRSLSKPAAARSSSAKSKHSSKSKKFKKLFNREQARSNTNQSPIPREDSINDPYDPMLFQSLISNEVTVNDLSVKNAASKEPALPQKRIIKVKRKKKRVIRNAALRSPLANKVGEDVQFLPQPLKPSNQEQGLTINEKGPSVEKTGKPLETAR